MFAIGWVALAILTPHERGWQFRYQIGWGTVTLAPIFLAVGASSGARNREFGLDRELFLAGVTPRLWTIAMCLISAATGVEILLIGTAIGGTTLWGVHEATNTPLAVGTLSRLATWSIGSAVVAALLTVFGVVVGSRARSRSDALLIVLALAAVPVLLSLFSVFPPARWLGGLFPSPAAWNLFEARSDLRGGPAFRFGVPAGYLALTIALLTRGRSFATARTKPVTEAAPSGPSARSGFAIACLTLCVAALGFGLLVPQRLARTVPWWLNGQWVSDVAAGRDSRAVVHQYLSEVRAGNSRAAGRFALHAESQILPAETLALVRRAHELPEGRYVYSEGIAPGTVVLHFAADTDVTFCTVRRTHGWQIWRATIDGVCDRDAA